MGERPTLSRGPSTLAGLSGTLQEVLRPFSGAVAYVREKGTPWTNAIWRSVRKSFDVLAAFRDVLGKPVAEIPGNYERGELLRDTSMELETNATTGLSLENSLP